MAWFKRTMAYITKSTHIQFMDDFYQINNNSDLGVYSKDLKKMLDQLEAMLSYHNKLMMIRFDLHLKRHSKDNTLISKYFNRLNSSILKRFKLKRYAYVWCREHNKSLSQHYHVALLVDGNKYQSPHYVLEFCKAKWEALGQHFSYCWSEHRVVNRQHVNIVRGNWSDYQEVIYWLSYLAKSNTKTNRLSTTNKYSTSRLKRKVDANK